MEPPKNLSPNKIIDELESYLNEILNISEYNKSEIGYLLNFFDKISQKYISFNKDIDFTDKDNSDNSFPINLSVFYIQNQIILNSFCEIGKKIKDDIISGLESFSENLNNDYNKIITKINSIIRNLKEENKKVVTIKYDYYQANKVINDSKVKLNRNKYGGDKNDENQNENQKDKPNLYKKEIDIANKLFLHSKSEFKTQLNELENIEENKNNFIGKIIEKYILLFKDPITNLNNLDNFKNNYNNEEYLKNKCKFQNIINKDSSFLNNKWDIFTFQLSNNNEEIKLNKILNDNFDDEALTSLFLNIQEGEIMKIQNFDFGANDDFEILSVNETSKFIVIEDESEEINIKKLCLTLVDSKNKDVNLFNKILEIIDKNNDNRFYLHFLYCFINQKDYINLFKFNNYDNLLFFNTIIVDILSKLLFDDDLKSISYQILYTIILISEKTYFNNIFLCSLLSKNIIFQDLNKWMELIHYRIIYKINKRIKSYIDIKEFVEVNKTSKNKQYLIESLLSNYLIDYDNLSNNEKEKLNSKEGPNIIHSILKDFINHMCNFNVKDVKEIVMNICQIYNINKMEKINFYNIYLNTSSNTVRSKNDINYYSIPKTKRINNETTYEEIIIILRNISSFLEDKDLINILYLNKEISKKIKGTIYIEISKKDLKKKIEKWKEHLKIDTKKYKYNEIKQKIINNKIKTKYNSIIDLDVKRTSIKKKNEENKKKLSIILKACISCAEEVGYCQGMNFLMAYLLELIENEENSFYIMLGLLKSNFKIIFQNDLNKLTIFFYVLEKLIYLKIPEIYEHLKFYKIDTTLFSSPYFITLFTNIYPYLDAVNNLSLNKIFDYFIFKGWKNIFSSLLGVLYYNKDIILQKKDDELRAFLISGMIKSDIFKNENIFLFCRLSQQFTIPDTLYKKLNEEKELESKIDYINLDIPEETTLLLNNYYDNNNIKY